MNVIEVTTQRIRERISDGRLQPGQRLPSEPKLAAELGVSRSSLREAIRSLAQARVLEVRRGDGTFVSSLEPEHLLGDLSFVFDLMHDRAILQLFEVRRLLEPATTALATLRATDQQIAELKLILESMRSAVSVDELIALDHDFHEKIAGYTGNTMLGCLIEAMVSETWWERFWADMSGGAPRAAAIEQHTQIVRAIEARDPGLAAAAAAVHLSTFEEWLREELMRSDDEGPGQRLAPAAQRVEIDVDGLRSTPSCEA